MFYRLLGRIFFILWVAPALSELIRNILYPAFRDAATHLMATDREERRKKQREDMKDRLLLRLPAEWELREGIKIVHAYGWDRGKDPKDWSERISRKEFLERAAKSVFDSAPKVGADTE